MWDMCLHFPKILQKAVGKIDSESLLSSFQDDRQCADTK